MLIVLTVSYNIEEGCVRVDVIQSARSIANQNKTLIQHDF